MEQNMRFSSRRWDDLTRREKIYNVTCLPCRIISSNSWASHGLITNRLERYWESTSNMSWHVRATSASSNLMDMRSLSLVAGWSLDSRSCIQPLAIAWSFHTNLTHPRPISINGERDKRCFARAPKICKPHAPCQLLAVNIRICESWAWTCDEFADFLICLGRSLQL